MFEGIPTYPDPGRFWAVVEKYRVNIFYTAPTAIRALMRHGEGWPQRYDLSQPAAARHASASRSTPRCGCGTTTRSARGELPDRRHVLADRDRRLPHHAVPGRDAAQARLGARCRSSASSRRCVREDGTRRRARRGRLPRRRASRGRACCAARGATPRRSACARCTSSASRAATSPATARAWTSDGYFWLLGRVDDVINVSGHRLGTAEIESALVSHEAVTEAAVVGLPAPGEGRGHLRVRRRCATDQYRLARTSRRSSPGTCAR